MDSFALSPGYQLRDRAQAIAEEVTKIAFGRRPELAAQAGCVGRQQALQDTRDHLAHLAEAVDSESAALFLDHIAWAKVALPRRYAPDDDVDLRLSCMDEVLPHHLPAPVVRPVVDLIHRAMQALPSLPAAAGSHIDPALPLSNLAHRYLQALLRGSRRTASQLVLTEAARGTPVKQIYLQVFQPALWEVGRLWQTNALTVAQEHYCTAATQQIMSQLSQYMSSGQRNGCNLVATCVQGDLHEIGARMVSDFFEMAGWDTFFTGANTPHSSVIQAVVDRRADVLAISTTIASHLTELRELVAAVRADPRCRHLRIMVGGHPFNLDPKLWRHVGADGTAPDAETAITLAETWMAGVA